MERRISRVSIKRKVETNLKRFQPEVMSWGFIRISIDMQNGCCSLFVYYLYRKYQQVKTATKENLQTKLNFTSSEEIPAND